MFASFFQAEILKRNRKVTTSKYYYDPFHIPVDRVNSEKPLTERISAECQKLKHRFDFLQQEIERENSKRRTKISTAFASTLQTINVKSKKKGNGSYKENMVRPLKQTTLNLSSIIKKLAASEACSSNSVRVLLKSLEKQRQLGKWQFHTK